MTMLASTMKTTLLMTRRPSLITLQQSSCCDYCCHWHSLEHVETNVDCFDHYWSNWNVDDAWRTCVLQEYFLAQWPKPWDGYSWINNFPRLVLDHIWLLTWPHCFYCCWSYCCCSKIAMLFANELTSRTKPVAEATCPCSYLHNSYDDWPFGWDCVD